jgi:Mrp family chromosome partitioning ATPase
MLKFRKKKSLEVTERSLVLRADDGQALRVFDEQIVMSLRHMITGLSYNNDLPARIAMIAALQGEGVTYTSLALGTTIANDLNRSVCVVELNWNRPGLLAEISAAASQPKKRRKKKGDVDLPRIDPEFSSRLGLAEVLRDEVELDAVLLHTSLPHLTLLPAGNLEPLHRPTVARGVELRALIDSLSERFDHLLLDIPAVNSTSDAIALASLSDACCVVVRHGVTPVTQVQATLDDVQHLAMLGVILNQVSIHTPRWIRNLIPQQ